MLSNTIGFTNGTSGEIVLGTNSNYGLTDDQPRFQRQHPRHARPEQSSGRHHHRRRRFHHQELSVSTIGTLTTGDSAGGTFAGTLNSDYSPPAPPAACSTSPRSAPATGCSPATAAPASLAPCLHEAGTITLNGSTGKIGFAVETLSQGSTLTLDNSGVIGNAVNNRLGGAVPSPTPPALLNFQAAR